VVCPCFYTWLWDDMRRIGKSWPVPYFYTKRSAKTGASERTMSRLAKSFALFLSMIWLGTWGHDAMAAACVTAASGNWNAAATWTAGSACTIAGGNATDGPGADDTVTIGGAHTVTVTANAAATSIAITAPSGATNGVNINPGFALNVSGAITMAAPGTNGRTSTFAVGSGTLTAGSITINSGNGSKISQMTVSTGTITTTGNISFAGTAANAQFTSTGASMVNVGGNFGSGGALTGGTGTINFNGGAAQTIGLYTTYNNVQINNTAGDVQFTAGTTTIGGTLQVQKGTLDVRGVTLNVTGATTVSSTTSSTLLFSTSATGTKTFTGDVTIGSNGTLSATFAETVAFNGNVINSGGTWSETAAAVMTFAGNLQNDGAAWTASTGVHTFSGAGKTISGTLAVVIPSVTVSGTYQNNGTLTVATTLAGGGTLTNGATGILNIQGTSSITTLTNQGTATITGAGVISTTLANFTNSGTLNLNGSGTITGITNSNIINLTNSGTITALTNNAAGTLNISDLTVPTITTLTATAVGNTVNYSGAGAQTVKATTYHHLTLSTSGAKAMGATTINGDFTMSGTATTAPTGALTVGGDFTIGVGTTFTAGALAHSVGGNWSNSGTFTAGTSTVTFNGAAQQTLTGATTFNNLTVNNANGITLNSSQTVSGTLALTSGVVTTGANILTLSANCTDINLTNGTSWTRTNGFVAGNLRLTFPASATTCTYPVGSGSVYAPINLTKPLNLTGGMMTGSTTGNEHPNVASSPVDSSKDVNRFWTLSGDTIGASSYMVTFNFVTGDVDFGASPGGFVLGRYASGAWTTPTPLTPFALSITASLTGPIVGTTDFVAGEAGFVCSVPTGSPVGTTCVCDNFNRVNLNPSTMFPGASWSVSTNSGTFGLPRIVNNKLRLTDNTSNVATAATAPGAYPAAGNWVTVEFKHYAYNGTGADGIALTLSDSAILAAPGAFGGSLGYAQKTGINGFTGGWVGIAIDEFGNFSNNTEGRTGGPAPGLTLDSVAVRGSGSGQTGYPYLGGTTTLTPPIDNAASVTPDYGYAYRLTVDARCYQLDGTGCSNPSLAKKTLVTVERDTTGTGTSYTPLVPAFDAYVANASQADVPASWQLSFTGSTGGSTNIHEIIGLKICAQTIVPPAGYRIQVDNLTPTTCPSDPQPTVTISALNANGQVITNYTNTVNLAATLASGGGGGASSATWTPYPGNQGAWDAINKRYTFAAGDNGVAKFYLSDLVQQNVYITVSEYLGTLNSSLGTPVYFSSGAASFVVSTPDTLGAGVVAGRAHLMRVTRNKATCGGGTDAGFNGAKPIDGWYNPAVGDHPSGALAPQVCAPVSGACLPSYGSCQTLSIAPPVVDSSSNNLSLTFASGVANFCLVTSDVGKYSVGLRDDSVATGTPAVTGTSTTLTVRPFAVVVSNVKQGATNNPANNTSGGSVFAKAGTAFQATVGGYLWNSAGDTGSNGLPGVAADWSAITSAGIAPSYADTVTLAAGAPFAPAAGILSNGSVVVTGGSGTVSTLSYDEVGSFTLTAAPATSYLSSGVNLGNRVAIFSNPASASPTGWVGRFIPDHFDTAVVATATIPMPCPTGLTCPTLYNGFVYSGQPFSVQVTAKNLAGSTTQNYDGTLGYAKAVTLTAWDALGSTTTLNPSGLLTNISITAATFSAGVATTNTPIYTLTAVSTAPTNIFMRAGDTDNVTSLRAIPSSSVEGGVKVANGRVKIGNAHGSELLQLPMAATVQYWDGTNWQISATDSVTTVASTNVVFANWQKLTPASGWVVGSTSVVTPPASVVFTNGVASFILSKPGSGKTGSVDITTSAPTYLPSTTGRATFGVYKGNNEFIYLRENY